MSKLTALLVVDLFDTSPQARIEGRIYYDLDELNYRRFIALTTANPILKKVLDGSLIIERNTGTVCLVPVDLVSEAQEVLGN